MSDPVRLPTTDKAKDVPGTLADAAAEGFDHVVVVGWRDSDNARVVLMSREMTSADIVFELECAKLMVLRK